MLKRIQDRFSNVNNDDDEFNSNSYVPMQEEIDADMSWKDLSVIRNQYLFQGDYHCKLCPNRVLNTK